jgi:malate synthase
MMVDDDGLCRTPRPQGLPHPVRIECEIALGTGIAAEHLLTAYLPNWLEHGLVSRHQVSDAFERMARVVDEQNCLDPNYRPMAPNYD